MRFISKRFICVTVPVVQGHRTSLGVALLRPFFAVSYHGRLHHGWRATLQNRKPEWNWGPNIHSEDTTLIDLRTSCWAPFLKVPNSKLLTNWTNFPAQAETKPESYYSGSLIGNAASAKCPVLASLSHPGSISKYTVRHEGCGKDTLLLRQTLKSLVAESLLSVGYRSLPECLECRSCFQPQHLHPNSSESLKTFPHIMRYIE